MSKNKKNTRNQWKLVVSSLVAEMWSSLSELLNKEDKVGHADKPLTNIF